MAKGIEMNGYLRGKRGGSVYSVLNGEQVSRAYNSQPKNPRSNSQMSQRVKLAAAVGFYKRTKKFFKFAFKKTAKQSDYNAFIKENINITPYLRKEEVLNNVAVPAPYRMTSGDLYIDQKMNIDLAEDFSAAYLTSNYGNNSITVGGLMQQLGAQIGDMITIYSVQSLAADGVPSEFLDRAWGKYTFKEEDYAKSLSEVSYDYAYNLTVYDMLVNNRLGIQAKITVPGAAEDNYCCGVCIVLSRKPVGGSLQVSSSKLILNELAMSIWDNYRSEEQLELARNSYGATEDAFLVPEKESTHA